MHIMCRVVCVLLESGPDLWVPPSGMIPRSGTLASFPLRYLRLRASLQFNSILIGNISLQYARRKPG